MNPGCTKPSTLCAFMKLLLSIVLIFSLSSSAFGQSRIVSDYAEVKSSTYDTCSRVSFLIRNTDVKKQSGVLIVPVVGLNSASFKDDYSDENSHQFEYLGDVKGTQLSLIKWNNYNKEEFYLISQITGGIDTLIGYPVFAPNMRDFVCINNPGTDEEQYIQICELVNGSPNTRLFLRGKKGTVFVEVSCINRNTVIIKDSKDKYLKLYFQ